MGQRVLLGYRRYDPMGTNLTTIRVLVVDDHRMLRDALVDALGDEPGFDVVGSVDSLAGAKEFLGGREVDVILLDQRLPDGRGTGAVSELRGLSPGSRVIVISGEANTALLSEALAAGCVGLISKSESIVFLAESIRAAHRGTAVFSPSSVAVISAVHQMHADPRALTRRESEILVLIAEGRSTGEIAHQLDVSVHTLRNHVRNVLLKLGTHSRLEAVTLAIREGLIPPLGED